MKTKFSYISVMLLLLSFAFAGIRHDAALATEYFLRAEAMTGTMCDGTEIEMWGYAMDTAFGAEDGTVTVPGPVLEIPPGDSSLTIHMDNNLNVPTSIVIPGLIASMSPVRNGENRIVSFTHETSPGNAAPVDYIWNNLKPGTYLYQSGSHMAVQVQMGLYGAVKMDHMMGQAYDEVQTAYDSEVMLLFSEIDPALHQAVAEDQYGPGLLMTSTVDYQPKCFLINGECFSPGRMSIPAGIPGDTLLVRFLNAGLKTRVPALNGKRLVMWAEDGNLLPYPKNIAALHLEAGKTRDVLVELDQPGYIPVYDERLALTNAGVSPGGMLAYLEVASGMQYWLTVDVASFGPAGGTIQTLSKPAGIFCESNCSVMYNEDTELLLRATPDENSIFIGWSGGGCGGLGDCIVEMNGDRTVTAFFFPGALFRNILPVLKPTVSTRN